MNYKNRVPFLCRLPLINNWLPENIVDILEVGCSWGYLINSLATGSRNCWGVDINLDDISEAASRFGYRSNYSCAAAETLPFPSSSFDAVVMSEVLEHTQDERLAIAEAARVLRPQGTLIVTVPHRGPLEIMDLTNWKWRLPWLHEHAYGLKHQNNFSHFVPVAHYHRHYTLQRLTELFSEQFDVLDVQRGGGALFMLADFSALIKNPSIVATLFRIAESDYQIDYGPWSYNIGLCLRKRD